MKVQHETEAAVSAVGDEARDKSLAEEEMRLLIRMAAGCKVLGLCCIK